MEFTDLVTKLSSFTIDEILKDYYLDANKYSIEEKRQNIIDIKTPYEWLIDDKYRVLLLDNISGYERRDLSTLLNEKEDNLSNIKISKNSNKEKILMNFFSIEIPDDDEFVKEYLKSIAPNYPLFSHQIRAVEKSKKILERDFNNNMILHMPTGSGKTRTCMNIISDRLRVNKGLIVWLANNEELCDQAFDEFEKSWSHLGNREVDIFKLWGAVKGVEHGSGVIQYDKFAHKAKDGVIIAGLQKLNSVIKNNLNFLYDISENVQLVIFDEAHQSIAPTYMRVTEQLITNGKRKLIGLTATPGRTFPDPIENTDKANWNLADLYHNNKVLLECEGYDNPIDYLTENKFMARPIFESVENNFQIDMTEKEIESLKDHNDNNGIKISDDIIKKLAQNNDRTQLIISKILEMMERKNKIILFATDIAQVHSLTAILKAEGRKKGFLCESVTGDTPKHERNRKLSEFKITNEKIIMCNFGILTTGFDAPKVDAIFIARPIQSPVLYNQIVGRGLRGPKQGGEENCEIVTLQDNIIPGWTNISGRFLMWEGYFDENMTTETIVE